MKRIIDLVEKIFSDSEEERNIDLITLKYLVELRRERERTPLNEEWVKARNWTKQEREFISPYYSHSVGDYTIEIERAFKGYRVKLYKWRKGDCASEWIWSGVKTVAQLYDYLELHGLNDDLV